MDFDGRKLGMVYYGLTNMKDIKLENFGTIGDEEVDEIPYMPLSDPQSLLGCEISRSGDTTLGDESWTWRALMSF